MKTRKSGHFYIFETTKAIIGLNETRKKTIHIFPKTQNMQIRIMKSFNEKDDIVIKNVKFLIIENTKRKVRKGDPDG